MRRRDLVQIFGAMVVWPFAAQAQKAMPVIGFLSAASPGPNKPYVAAFVEGLSEAGYIEGQNVAIEYRWAESHVERLPALAADLVGRKVDVIVAIGPPSTRAAKEATSTIPIVFGLGSDPVALGFVASLARPGGNLTGISIMAAEITPKRLELLSELVPEARVIGLLVNPVNQMTERIVTDVQKAASAKGIQLSIQEARSDEEIDAAFDTLVQAHADALLIVADPLFDSRQERLAARAARHVLPSISTWREYPVSGGLISYGASITWGYRQGAIYTSKILHGANVAELPVQQPTKFELVVNIKTAQQLGLTVPQSILTRADEVIE